MFYLSVGVRQPFLVDELHYAVVGFRIVVAIALKHFLLLGRILNRNEWNVGLFFGADKEYKRFFSREFLVVTHTSYAVMKFVSFTC